MSEIRTFEDSEYWKVSRQFRLFVTSEVVKKLPQDERFALASQLRRAARSVTANIAEGFGRFHSRDNYKFCSNARGSLFEVLDHLISAHDDARITKEALADGRVHLENAIRIRNGYIKYFHRAADDTGAVREDSESFPLAGLGSAFGHQ